MLAEHKFEIMVREIDGKSLSNRIDTYGLGFREKPNISGLFLPLVQLKSAKFGK